jgi:hypothetical protein
MDPLAQRILDEIQHSDLSADAREQLAAAIRGNQRLGHPNPFATWASTSQFLIELCEWAAALPAEQLPPRETDAARYFGRSVRTINRWLGPEHAGIDGWDGFLRYWVLAVQHNGLESH